MGGKPVALKTSFYATSPLGNEAATKNFGAALLSHQTAGKTQFAAYSFDVKIEGKNVCRHIDITTSNHGSYPGNTPPFPSMEQMTMLAVERLEANLCPCCGLAKHATHTKDGATSTGALPEGKPMGRDDYYRDLIDKAADKGGLSKYERRQHKKSYNSLIADAKARKGCTCPRPVKTKLLPEPPCDVHHQKPPKGPARTTQKRNIGGAWDEYRPRYQLQTKTPTEYGARVKSVQKKLTAAGETRAPTRDEIHRERQANHLTAKSAGGCPGNAKNSSNVQAHHELCLTCQGIDARFGAFQGIG